MYIIFLFHFSAILKDSKGINTLTCNNYYDVLDLLLYLEDFQMGVEIKKYDRVTTDLVPCNKYHNRFKLKVNSLLLNESFYRNLFPIENLIL